MASRATLLGTAWRAARTCQAREVDHLCVDAMDIVVPAAVASVVVVEAFVAGAEVTNMLSGRWWRARSMLGVWTWTLCRKTTVQNATVHNATVQNATLQKSHSAEMGNETIVLSSRVKVA